MMEDAERQKLMQRCHDAELRAKVLAECLDLIAGKFSAMTSGLVGMRINRLEDSDAKRGADIGDLKGTTAELRETVAKARTAYESLDRKLKAAAFSKPGDAA